MAFWPILHTFPWCGHLSFGPDAAWEETLEETWAAEGAVEEDLEEDPMAMPRRVDMKYLQPSCHLWCNITPEKDAIIY
jgi:hypothetical protein